MVDNQQKFIYYFLVEKKQYTFFIIVSCFRDCLWAQSCHLMLKLNLNRLFLPVVCLGQKYIQNAIFINCPDIITGNGRRKRDGAAELTGIPFFFV
jgi:hypothetical protein